MYSCSNCHRTYRTQNSLTRHAHSHRNDRKHQCGTCGVIFHRKDLLSRHLKLHQKPFTATTQDSDDYIDTASRRQRCHTACDSCRELRIKCNGQSPCHSCQKAGSICQYLHRSSRLSHLPPEGPGPTGDSNRASQTGPVDVPYQQLTSVTNEGDFLETGNDPGDSQVIAEASSAVQQDFQLLADCSLSGVPADLNISDDGSLTDMLPWPWLHEDLFLPADSDFFAAPVDQMGFPNPLNCHHLEPQLHVPLVGTSFTTAHSEVHQSRSALFCQAEDTSLAMRHVQIHASEPEHLEIGTTTESTPSNGQGTASQSASSGRPKCATSDLEQTRIVQELIAFASAPLSGTKSKDLCASFWEGASTKIVFAFDLPSYEHAPASPVLYHFCNNYVEHFAPLWPLLGPHSLLFDALHPLLFLVLSSIGAMYCGPQASVYGAAMHTAIRGVLTTALELEEDEQDFVWLAQARLLTQVAALYFGQPKSFTYAHHLGALLVTQARRNDLFSAAKASNTMRKFHRMKGVSSDEERLLVWYQLETRRRLAFGIFRGDTYTSSLLHTKPLISMEEIDLPLPTCDAVWRGHTLSASLCLHMIEHDQTPSRELWASDIFRIAMDMKEPLPPLDPVGHELLMFGLQYPLWRFSKDREMLERLTGGSKTPSNCDEPIVYPRDFTVSSVSRGFEPTRQGRRFAVDVSIGSEAQDLESTVRKMEDLQHEWKRLMSALMKWEHSLPLVKTFVRTSPDRSCLMSGLILFHLCFIRLHVPLEELHQIQYRMADNRKIDGPLLTTVHGWASSHLGRTTAERARNICSIIAKESEVEESKKAKFNLLAFIGLHHCAVLIWAYAAAQDSRHGSDEHASLLTLGLKEPIAICKAESNKLLSSFVELYNTISPAQWSSFAKATRILSTKPFPITTSG